MVKKGGKGGGKGGGKVVKDEKAVKDKKAGKGPKLMPRTAVPHWPVFFFLMPAPDGRRLRMEKRKRPPNGRNANALLGSVQSQKRQQCKSERQGAAVRPRIVIK